MKKMFVTNRQISANHSIRYDEFIEIELFKMKMNENQAAII